MYTSDYPAAVSALTTSPNNTSVFIDTHSYSLPSSRSRIPTMGGSTLVNRGGGDDDDDDDDDAYGNRRS